MKRAKDKEPRHVRLYHWMLRTEAWLDLDTVAKCAYIELVARYGGPGSNNGSIPCSLLELSTALRVSKQTAMRALDRLQEHGFVVCTKRGGFNQGSRLAAEWMLTEFKDDRPSASAIASKDFTRWRKTNASSISKPSRVSTRNHTGVEMEQSQEVTVRYGSTSTPEEENDGSISKPLLVYQGRER